MIPKLPAAGLLFALLLTVSTNAAATPTYAASMLGSLGGTASWASGMNNAGMVVGSALDATGEYRAFVSVDGVMRIAAPDSSDPEAFSINDKGQYVTANGVYNLDGTRVAIPSGFLSMRAINNEGQIGGSTTLRSSPAVYTPGGAIVGVQPNLPSSPRPHAGYVFDISDNGTVVGSMTTAGGRFGAYSYADGQLHMLEDLGGNTYAKAVNNHGIAVGRADRANLASIEAVMWDAQGHLVNLHALLPNAIESDAWDINDAGAVVGDYRSADGDYHGFLYQDGRMFDLNSLLAPDTYLQIVGAYAINQSGQIAAEAGLVTYEGVLLTPVTPVPEPSELLMLACGALLCIVWAAKARATAPRPAF